MSFKRRHSEVGNLDDDGEPFFQSPLFKEIKANDGNEGLKIDLKAEPSACMKDEEGEESKFRDDREISAHMKKLREKFFDFHRKYVAQVNPKPYFNELKKDLLLKLDQVLDADSITDFYEKILQRTAFTVKPGRRAWNEDENLLLVSIATYICKAEEKDFASLAESNWEFVASFFPGRKAEHIKLQWLSFLKTKLTQAPWTPFEDDMLKQIMKEKGRGNHWKEIAAELNARCNSQVYRHGKQCRERWINHLDPAINRGPWTDEEDLKMLKYFLSVGGKKWADISKMMRDRTENAVKNRWNSLYKKFMHELGYDQSTSNDSEVNQAEKERKVTQRIIDFISKNMAAKGTNISIIDKKYEYGDLSTSLERRFQDLSTISESSVQRRRSYSSESSLSESQILNKRNLLKELVIEEKTPKNRQKNMLDEQSSLQQNMEGTFSSKRKGSWNAQTNIDTQKILQSLGLDSIMGENNGPAMISRKSMPSSNGDDGTQSLPLFRKMQSVPGRQLGHSLGVIKELSNDDPQDHFPSGVQDASNLILKEKSLREFQDQANKVVGANDLQFAVVDLTKGELYFVNSLNKKNLSNSLNAIQSAENEAQHWPNSPLFNFSEPLSNYLGAGSVGMLNQDFSNMRISSEKRRDPAKEMKIEPAKEPVKSMYDLNPFSRPGSNVEPVDNMFALNNNQFGTSHLFANY